MIRRKKPSDLLLERMREAGLPIPTGACIERTYASGSSRELGAWSWYVTEPDGKPMPIGSQWSVTDILRLDFKASKDFHGDTHLDPPSPESDLADQARQSIDQAMGRLFIALGSPPDRT